MRVTIKMEIEKELTSDEVQQFEKGEMNGMMPDKFYSFLYESELDSIAKPNGFEVKSCAASFQPIGE